ncbi:hypothetical protein QFZ77_004913 [Paenibacillus sp. V4I3]|uniref:DUF6463 family protein n=1 Tax=unclassified Paenibacillus TaxID=185978 RepID=UPI00278A1B05|nr:MULTISPECIES: DUF6463 family protein [unclassified Paenibacillus]MDQ0876254.1 hypothetical protein [Paenibacillus sp. V4I3]MDQ0887713.1 hypothetical protein [Paenibacillus sp. V4I9]
MAIQKHSGWMMEWTSYIHNAVGLILFWKPISEMVKAGIWNSVDSSFDRSAAIWFLFFGVLLWIIGRMIRWMTKEKGLAIPRFVGWHILILSVVGAIIMPISGFWLVIPQGLYFIRKS